MVYACDKWHGLVERCAMIVEDDMTNNKDNNMVKILDVAGRKSEQLLTPCCCRCCCCSIVTPGDSCGWVGYWKTWTHLQAASPSNIGKKVCILILNLPVFDCMLLLLPLLLLQLDACGTSFHQEQISLNAIRSVHPPVSALTGHNYICIAAATAAAATVGYLGPHLLI